MINRDVTGMSFTSGLCQSGRCSQVNRSRGTFGREIEPPEQPGVKT